MLSAAAGSAGSVLKVDDVELLSMQSPPLPLIAENSKRNPKKVTSLCQLGPKQIETPDLLCFYPVDKAIVQA